jgi:hypothetical protein
MLKKGEVYVKCTEGHKCSTSMHAVEVAGAAWEETTASPRNMCSIQHSRLESQPSLGGR